MPVLSLNLSCVPLFRPCLQPPTHHGALPMPLPWCNAHAPTLVYCPCSNLGVLRVALGEAPAALRVGRGDVDNVSALLQYLAWHPECSPGVCHAPCARTAASARRVFDAVNITRRCHRSRDPTLLLPPPLSLSLCPAHGCRRGGWRPHYVRIHYLSTALRCRLHHHLAALYHHSSGSRLLNCLSE